MNFIPLCLKPCLERYSIINFVARASLMFDNQAKVFSSRVVLDLVAWRIPQECVSRSSAEMISDLKASDVLDTRFNTEEEGDEDFFFLAAGFLGDAPLDGAAAAAAPAAETTGAEALLSTAPSPLSLPVDDGIGNGGGRGGGSVSVGGGVMINQWKFACDANDQRALDCSRG